MRTLYKISENLKGCDYMSHPGVGGSIILEPVFHGLVGSVYRVKVSEDTVL